VLKPQAGCARLALAFDFDDVTLDQRLLRAWQIHELATGALSGVVAGEGDPQLPDAKRAFDDANLGQIDARPR